jgi:multiple sugar transport system permease protein
MTQDRYGLRAGEGRIGLTGVFFALVVISLLTVFPLFWMVASAFKTGPEVYALSPLPAAPTLDNFRYVFTELPFAGRELIFTLIFSTLLVSLPVILVPLFVLVRAMGMLNSYAGLIIPAIFHAFGIFLLRQFYLGVPRELEEAAILDGAGYWRVYTNIILPLSRPILAALAVFFFLANWNSFLWPLTITSDPNLWVVQTGIASFQQQYASAQNYIMAASTVVAMPTMILFFIFQKQLVESIKTSGFK